MAEVKSCETSRQTLAHKKGNNRGKFANLTTVQKVQNQCLSRGSCFQNLLFVLTNRDYESFREDG